MTRMIIWVLTFFLAACTAKNTDSTAENVNTKKADVTPVPVVSPVKNIETFSKTLREAIYFSNSLEREALRLIFKDRSLQKLTLFSALSYIIETNSGVKKSTPQGLDCGQFQVLREAQQIRVIKSCYKPSPDVALISIISEDREYKVEFKIREWGSVVGLSTALTGDDIICHIQMKDKKLNTLNCDNWSYLISEDQLSTTILKAKEFSFQREAPKQFVIKGGYFKELVENKKIDISVPLEGKIKIFEKEIQVKDDFAEKKEEQNEKKEELKKIEEGRPSGREQEENRQEEGQQESHPEEGRQKSDQEGAPETAPERGGR